MASQTDIVNLALLRLGQGSIATLNEDSVEANAASRLWTPVVEEVLRAHPWNFAVKTAELAATDAEPGWTYAFALPNDCLRALQMVNPDFHKFEVREGLLLTENETVTLKYIAKVTDTTKFDSQFVTALSYKLAVDLCLPVTQKADRQAALFRLYMNALRAAQQSDAQEAKHDDPAGQGLLDSRN